MSQHTAKLTLKPLAAIIALASAPQVRADCKVEYAIANVEQYNAAVELLNEPDCDGMTVTWNMASGVLLEGDGLSFSLFTHPLIISGDAASPAILKPSGVWIYTETQLALTNLVVDAGKYGGSSQSVIRSTGTSMTIRNSTFKGASGGMIDTRSDLIIEDSAFLDNRNSDRGGAIYADNNDLVSITGSTFSGNSSEQGGAIYFAQPVQVTIEDSVFENNHSQVGDPNTGSTGGALSLYTESSNDLIEIRGSTFRNNTSWNEGGAVYSSGYDNLSITDSLFEGNTVEQPEGFPSANADGGAVWVSNTTELTLIRTTFLENSAEGEGGGLAVIEDWMEASATVPITISQTNFTNNTSGNDGAAAYIQNSFYEDFHSNQVLISQSLFSGNDSSSSAALMITDNDTVAKIENSTFDGNTAWTGASALYVGGADVLAGSHIRHSTFTNNTISYPSGVGANDSVISLGDLDEEDFDISHTIIAENDFGDAAVSVNALNYQASFSYSLLDDQTNDSGTAYVLDGTNLLGGDGLAVLDPELEPLADNGGPTLTRHPQEGSPVIDAGDEFISGAPEFDQRGTDRIIGIADIGAVELNFPPLVLSTTWTIEEGTPFTFNLNDYFSDPENKTLTFNVTDQPSWMSFNNAGFSTNGVVGAAGTYSISVTISDPFGMSIDATIFITVTADSSEPSTDKPKNNKGGSLGFLTTLFSASLLFSRRKSLN